MRTTPSPSRSAVSTESASRPASGSGMTSPVSGSIGRPSAARVAPSGASAWRTMYRSTTTSIEWRLYLSSFGASVMSTISPSTRTRTKPWRRAPSKTRSPFGLAVLDERAENEQAGALGQRQDLVDDLLDGLALDGVAVGAVRDADPREQQAEVVVDLGDGADRRPRVARRALLVDRDRRRQAVDLVDVRLLHLAEELAGVRAQALDVPALALGVDRVEGEARLAAARQAGDDDEPVARERDVHVLEVVFARAAHDESILGHVTSVPDETQTEQAFVRARATRTPAMRALLGSIHHA